MKESKRKLFFRRKRDAKDDEDFQIISNEELFEDVADYEEEDGQDQEEPDLEDGYSDAGPDDAAGADGMPGEDIDTEAAQEEEKLIDTEDSENAINKDTEAAGGEDADAEKNGEDPAGEDAYTPENGEDSCEDEEEGPAGDNASIEKKEDAAAGEDAHEKGDDSASDGEYEEEDDAAGDEEYEEEDDAGDEEYEEEDDAGDGEYEEEDDSGDDDIREINLDEEESSEDKEKAEEEKAQKKQRRKKRLRIALLVILGIFATAYLGIAGFFYSHFYYNTQINGTDFSLKNVSQVQEYMGKQVDDYVLLLKESDGDTEKIYGTDIDLEYVKDASIDKLVKEQNPLLWISALWKTPVIEASVGVNYDKKKLDEVIAGLVCMREEEQTPSVSACPAFVETKFVIQEEKLGTQIDQEKFPKAVAEAVSGFQPELDMTAEECYIPPVFTRESPEVIAANETMNGYLGANITLDFSPYTEVIDSAVIAQWIVTDENMQVIFNQDAVRAYVAGLAEKYDTYGKPRTFTTGFGNVVQVDGGSYGWQIDQEAEFNALIANIQNAETVTREPNYARRALSHEGNDFGNTYAEVDLTNQHMFYFQDGQCVLQSSVVTGNPNKGNGTPQGTYTLAYKSMNQVLRGKKLPDGTYEYESPVTYWMPFNGGIGFHDATWQAAFGGSRYLTYGSHGCVNMPAGAAGQLYGMIQAGTPVICHY